MDRIQRDKIAAKLKKIKALAERGVGGEKETAMRMYEDLKARYELEDEEKRMLKKAAWYSNLMDKRKPPTALLGEPEEED